MGIGESVVASCARGAPSSGIGVLCTVEGTTHLGSGAAVVTLRGERRVSFHVAPRTHAADRARVTVAEDVGTRAVEAHALAVAGAQRYRATLAELGHTANLYAGVPEDPIDASYRLASLLRISEPERQHVLESPTAAERLRLLATVFERERVLLEATISAGGR